MSRRIFQRGLTMRQRWNRLTWKPKALGIGNNPISIAGWVTDMHDRYGPGFIPSDTEAERGLCPWVHPAGRPHRPMLVRLRREAGPMRHYAQDDQGRKTFKHRSHTGQGEFMLVGTGKNAYLWVGDKDGKFLGTLSGASLRQMAEQILAGNPFDDQGGARPRS